MSGFHFSRGPARAAPAYFPYKGHGTLADVWAGRQGMASVPRIELKRTFCDQCQRRVTEAEATACQSSFCKGRTA